MCVVSSLLKIAIIIMHLFFFFKSWVIFNRFVVVQVSDKIVTFLIIIRTPAHTLRLLDRVMFIDVFRKPPQETAGET